MIDDNQKPYTDRTDGLYDPARFSLHHLEMFLSVQIRSWSVWSSSILTSWSRDRRYIRWSVWPSSCLPGRSRSSLRDVPHISWIGSVLYKSCTTSRSRLGSIDDLDSDLSHIFWWWQNMVPVIWMCQEKIAVDPATPSPPVSIGCKKKKIKVKPTRLPRASRNFFFFCDCFACFALLCLPFLPCLPCLPCWPYALQMCPITILTNHVSWYGGMAEFNMVFRRFRSSFW